MGTYEIQKGIILTTCCHIYIYFILSAKSSYFCNHLTYKHYALFITWLHVHGTLEFLQYLLHYKSRMTYLTSLEILPKKKRNSVPVFNKQCPSYFHQLILCQTSFETDKLITTDLALHGGLPWLICKAVHFFTVHSQWAEHIREYVICVLPSVNEQLKNNKITMIQKP